MTGGPAAGAYGSVPDLDTHLLERLSDASAIGIMSGEDGLVIEANDQFLEMVGYSRDDLERGLVDWQAMTPPEYAELDRTRTAELLERGALTPFEKEYVRKDGSRVPVLVGGVLLERSPFRWACSVVDLSGRKLANERSNFLVEAGDILGEGLDVEAMLRELARLAVPRLADWCFIELVDDEGIGTLGASAAADPERAPLGERLRALYPLDLSRDDPVTRAIAAGRTQLLGVIDRPVLEAMARDEQHLALLEELGLRSAAVAPLPGRERVYGAVLLATAESGRILGPGEVALANDLARRTALAIENVLLLDAERLARNQIERLHALTSALSGALTPAEVTEVALEQGMAAAETDSAVIALLDESGVMLETAGYRGYTERIMDPWERFSVNLEIPIAQAVRRREAIFLESAAQILERYPDLAAHVEASGDEVWVSLPLVVSRTPLGVLFFGARQPRRFDVDDRTFVQAVAEQCGQALERAQLFEREHVIAATLQRSMLPQHLPQVPGVALAARYLAGNPGLEVGGDWYDAFTLSDGRVALSIGDVVGRGLRAASTMSQLRNALRALLFEGLSPAAALRRLNRLVDEMQERFATLLVAIYDPRSGTLQIANAGHPPPLLVRADGVASFVDAPPSVPLGALADPAFSEASTTLESGGTLLLYTDGLVEERTRSLDEGLERLRRESEQVLRPFEDAVSRLVSAMVGSEGRGDDVAIIALRALDRVELEVASDPQALASVRGELRTWLRTLGATDAEASDVLVAAGEACENAIEHSGSRTFAIQARRQDDGAEIVVRDHGRWSDEPPAEDRGRGLALIEALVDRVEIVSDKDGTEVRMHRHLERAEKW